MKQLFVRICALALLSSVRPGQAQATAVAARPAGPFSYDTSQEVTLHGTVSSVLAKPAVGMIMGSHLLLTTRSGAVDVSLGTFGLRGEGALVVETGQQVEVTGVMKRLKDKQVFLARTVKAGNQVYAIRNEHGISMSPQARQRASQKAQENGETP